MSISLNDPHSVSVRSRRDRVEQHRCSVLGFGERPSHLLASSCGLKPYSSGIAAVAIASSSAGAGRGERPRRVGEALRVKLPQQRHDRHRGDRVKQRATLLLSNPTSLHLVRPCEIFDSSLTPHESTSPIVLYATAAAVPAAVPAF